MRECRYRGECEHENYNPCYPLDDVVCKGYQPMPDVSALLKLADEMESEGLDGWASGPVNVGCFARRIREAVGA